MSAYYNEIDPYAAQWLRNLIAAGHIAPGDVDERSIEDVKPNELLGYTQCHFFAGIGVWSYALRCAGWPDDRPIWTGSCPCQPFSAAGKGDGFTDERHLWPAWFHLISECKPRIIIGEQVASTDALSWFDLVQSDLDATGYAVGAFDLCAAGVGAPHIRQRLWFVGQSGLANANHDEYQRAIGGIARAQTTTEAVDWTNFTFTRELERAGSDVRKLANADGSRSQGYGRSIELDATQGRKDAARYDTEISVSDDTITNSGMGDTCVHGHATVAVGRPIGEGEIDRRLLQSERPNTDRTSPCPTDGFWRDADWLFCRDGKWRPVEPRTFPLANGITNRVGRLRSYGNAIVAPVAQTFIEAYIETQIGSPECQNHQIRLTPSR